MAQKRALRSAPKLNNISVMSCVEGNGKDHSSNCKNQASPEAARLDAAAGCVKGNLVDASSMTPKKRRKLEPGVADMENLTSDTISPDRPAGHHSTNAPLRTPQGSRLVTSSQLVDGNSPSRTGVSRPTTSTGILLEQACAHLIRSDPRLQPLIEKHPCQLFSPEGLADEVDPFQSLCSGIMAQQVSGAAAKSIKAKFVNLFPNIAEEAGREDEAYFQSKSHGSFFPSPVQVAPCDVSFLRKAGLSARKAEYIKGLAEKFVSGELTAAMLIKASDEEMIARLTSIRGLGLWSVQMFACFALKRTDIFSTGRGRASTSAKEPQADAFRRSGCTKRNGGLLGQGRPEVESEQGR
ncbi:MAG: hypothetical protein Q9170_003351 [Blastenia crenularia]